MKWIIRIAGLLLLLGWIAALAIFAPDDARSGALMIANPKPSLQTVGYAGDTVPLKGRARRRSGCQVDTRTERIPIRNSRLEGSFQLPEVPGQQLVWLHVECDDKLRERYARRVQVNVASKRKRAEILRVHMSSKALHRWINRVFPPLLNKQVAKYLKQKASEKPKGLLVLVPGGEVRIDEAWIQVIGRRLELKMSVNVNVAYRGRGILKKLVKIPIVERLEPVTGTVLLTQWPKIELTNLRLESTRCKRYETRRFFVNRMLESACKRLYRSIAKRIENAVSKEATKQLKQVDPGKIVGRSLVRWSQQVGLAGYIKRLVRGANFGLSRGKPPVKRKDNLSFSISVSRKWLGRDAPVRINIQRTSAPVDLGISVALINRVLSFIFDRDLLKVLKKLQGFSRAAGFEKELNAVIEWLQQDGAQSVSRALDQLLDAAQLEFASDIKIQPLLRVGEDGGLILFASDVRLLQAQKKDDHAAISLTAAARLYPRSSKASLFLEPDPGYLLQHIAFEPVSTIDTALARRVHYRYAAFGNFIQDQLGRIGGWAAGDPLVDTATVEKVLASFRPVPVRFETVGIRVEASKMRGDFANQVIVLRGNTRLK